MTDLLLLIWIGMAAGTAHHVIPLPESACEGALPAVRESVNQLVDFTVFAECRNPEWGTLDAPDSPVSWP